jgi:hypothetical protein
MEFFKDESRRVCKQCGRQVLNPKVEWGCAIACQQAEKCLGKELFEKK